MELPVQWYFLTFFIESLQFDTIYTCLEMASYYTISIKRVDTNIDTNCTYVSLPDSWLEYARDQ